MEFSFKDIFGVIKKNIAVVLVVSLLCAVCSFFATSFFVKKTYTATVKLYVSTDSDGKSSYDDLNSYNYASKLVATYIQMLNTNNFFTDVSEELNQKYTASQLKGMISFKGVEDTEIFEASVSSESPTETKKIADAVANTAPKTIAEILKNNAQLKIVDEAVIPKAPTSPNVSKNVFVAFLIGLVASLVFAFVRDYFDVKIKYDEEMTTLANLPVLAAIPDFESYSVSAKSEKSGSNTKGSNTKRTDTAY